MSNLPAIQRPAGVKFIGTGLAVPRQLVTNKDLEKKVDTNDAWIVQRTGIKQRYICSDDEKCHTLAAEALRQAMINARIGPDDLDLILVATMTPDMNTPSVACQAAALVGAVPCGAMDINLACTGFVTGLNIASNFIETGMFRTIAVVGAEKLSSLLSWEDRRSSIIFGDGAGAAILTASDDPSQHCFYQAIHSDGTKGPDLYIPRTESDLLVPESFNGEFNTVQMNGREVFKFAVSTIQKYLADAMEKCGLEAKDVAMVIPHQSNARIIESARERCGFSEEQVYVNIDRYGNTSAASVGICLHELTEQGRLKKGDTVIFVGVGAGVTWATSIWKL